MPDNVNRKLLRASLVFVWLATAFVSILEFRGQSARLLIPLGPLSSTMESTLILGGAAIDAVLGFAMWFKPGRRTYLVALAFMVAMTLTATVIDPALWLNPLGPLTKNVPIAVALVILLREAA